MRSIVESLQNGSRSGITLSASGTEENPTSGFLVSVLSEILILKDLTAETVLESLASMQLVLQSYGVRSFCFGLYVFSDGERVSIDANVQVLDREAALVLGAVLNQESVWDCVNSLSLYTGQKAELNPARYVRLVLGIATKLGWI